MGPYVECQRCKDETMQRIRRRGFLQKRVYPLFGYYPWKCMRCKQLLFKRVRGERAMIQREPRME